MRSSWTRSPRGPVVWVNGAFGVGKTSVARRLAQALPARFYDPEVVGVALHRIVPRRIRPDDFQDFRLWRAITVRAISLASRRGVVVVPMTVIDTDVRAHVFGGLADRGVAVAELWLRATAATIAERLTARGDDPASWPHEQIERCVRFEASSPDLCLVDAERSVEEICDHVVDALTRAGGFGR